MSWPSRSTLRGPGALPSHWHLLTQNRGSQGDKQHGQQARHMHMKTHPSPEQMRNGVSLDLSLHQHQTPPRSIYRNIIHKVRRQGGGGGAEGVLKMLVWQIHAQHYQPWPETRPDGLHFGGWLVGWLLYLNSNTLWISFCSSFGLKSLQKALGSSFEAFLSNFSSRNLKHYLETPSSNTKWTLTYFCTNRK